VLADILSRKDRLYIDEGRTLTLLPSHILEDGIALPTQVAPLQPQGIVERVKISNRLHPSLVEDRQKATPESLH
jgi:hypothetical protein